MHPLARRAWPFAAVVVAMVACPAGASADITAFLGVTPTPDTRLARGLAAGGGLVVVAFETELARIGEDTAAGRPSLTTVMGNVLLQTPVAIGGVQLYGTSGVGVYRERLGDTTETAVAGNVGGGVKIGVAGPLKLRLDYRLFRLRGAPIHAVYHRAYAGATLGF
jgi:hypothetical protein